ncbi:MAG: 1-acyl-sn-glycerol-3-phosphate acyltransferase [Promethearchaeota archaeon]
MEEIKKSNNLLQWEQENRPNNDKELHFKKSSNEFFNQILKYNLIDPLNTLYRRFIDLLNLTEQEKELQWWGANIYVHAINRFVWRIDEQKVEGHIFPQYGNNAGKGGILVSNHESHLDPFFVGGTITGHVRTQWMSKRDNFRTPIIRSIFTNLGAYENNKDDLKETWEKSLAILESGQWIGMFPEGTRSTDGSIGQFKTGAVRLAIEAGVPIVPAAVIGSRDVLPKGRLLPKPAKIIVRMGKPIFYNQYDPEEITYELIRKLSDELRQEVIDLLEGKHEYAHSVIEFAKKSKKQQDLSISSPVDDEKKVSFKELVRYYFKRYLHLIDDTWITLINSAGVFGLRKQFELLCWQFNGNFIQKVMCDSFLPYERINYKKYLPKEGAAVICSNHNSEWDVILNAVACQQEGRRLYQMAKESLFQIPLVNAWIRIHLAFPLIRGDHDEGAYRFAIERLKEGELVMIYPEGTTHGGPDILEGHTGAVRLAIEAKVPIIPVGITGTENSFPKHAKMFIFGKMSVFKMGKPFTEHVQYFDKPIPDFDELKRLTDLLMQGIKELLVYDNFKI